MRRSSEALSSPRGTAGPDDQRLRGGELGVTFMSPNGKL
jgi:hypothetical protein